ncbi:hypothetical protein AB4Y96_09430 [Phyllobacterium sp. TAF24]|uniref:hypothetical protein n=1 Tax=Phyllobacterium sp. TAF24 TaxID=3233068 RepID=UPI003F987A34
MRKKLIDTFAGRIELPIEVTEASDVLVNFGIQDEIILSPADTDPGKVRGIFYQFTKHPAVYAAPHLVTLIVYSQNVDLGWQRLICCKELIHLCDGKDERTDKVEEVSSLVEKLLGPLSTEDYGLADLMAAVDKLAIYQALAILFPLAARDVAILAMDAGERTIDEIVEWVQLPPKLVELVLSEEWPGLMEAIVDC